MSSDSLFARIDRLTRRAMEILGEEVRQNDAPLGEDNRRLEELTRLCGLDALGTDVLVCLCAVELDPFMRTAVRALQRESGKPWIEIGTIAELLALPPSRVPELGRLFG